jgi:hypothetical protein
MNIEIKEDNNYIICDWEVYDNTKILYDDLIKLYNFDKKVGEQ